jgi:hypothetical protein
MRFLTGAVVLDYDEFDKLVNDNIPSAKGKYEIIAYEELSNDSAVVFEEVGGDYDDEFFQKLTLPDIEAGNLMYRAGSLLEVLCHKGVILPGNYIIEVSW